MANSPRMRWPYPPEGVDPWYEWFQSMVEAQDATAFGLEDVKNIVLSGGGVISWDASTGLLSWASDIAVNVASTGFQETIAAGSVYVLTDGEFGYFPYVIGPSANTPVTLLLASSLPPADQDRPLLLFRRVNGRIYWRNGAILRDGDSYAILMDGPAGLGIDFELRGAALGAAPTLNLAGPVPVAGSVGGGSADYEFQIASTPVPVTTTPYALAATGAYYVNVGGPAVVNLASAAGFANQYILVKTLTANAVTINALGGETIDGAAAFTLTALNQCVLLHSAGGGATYNWYVVSEKHAAGVTAVTASSPLTSSGGLTPNITHDASGVVAAAYTFANVTVDAKGHITVASSGTPVTSVTASAPLSSSGGQTPDISLGTVGTGNGGTGLVGTPTAGQLPIGNGAGYTLATLTAGSGISVTNGAGSITIAATGSAFTLTAAEAVAAGQMVACTAGGLAQVADSTVAGRYPALGVCISGGAMGNPIIVQCAGAATVFAALAAGTTYFLSTAGAVAASPPMGALVSHAAVQAYSATSGVLLVGSPAVVLGP